MTKDLPHHSHAGDEQRDCNGKGDYRNSERFETRRPRMAGGRRRTRHRSPQARDANEPRYVIGAAPTAEVNE